MSQIGSWLQQIAPTIATALGGPLAGMAVTAVSKALNVEPEKVSEVINSNKLTADQVAAIQQAELALKQQAQEMNLDFAKLLYSDEDSARKMQIATQSVVPSLLSFIVIGGFATIIGMKFAGISVPSDPLIQDLVTTLRDGVILVLSFYFGSSAGSQAKDFMLHNSVPVEKK